MNKRKSIPDIRFPDFNIDWDFRRLGDEVEFFSGLTYSPDNIVKKNGTFVLRSSNVKNGEIIETDNVYVENEAVNSINVQVGDIIVVVRNGSRSLIGKHATIKKTMKNTVIGAFMTGIHSEHSSFVNALLDTRQFEVEIHKNLGATINQITVGNFKKMEFFFPLNSEQEKIGSFFNKLDQTIVLQQQLLNDHKQLKKAMLQKMFPQKGESIPKIRFAGFNDDWVINILGDVVEIRRGLTYKPDDVTSNGIRVLRSSNIKEDIFELREDDVFVREGAINIKKVENGDILITAANGSTRLVGKHAIINNLLSNTVHGGFMLTITSEYNPFINAWMSSSEYKRTLEFVQGGNGSIGNLSSKTLENAKISIPSIEERQLIGKYFTKLESLISFHHEKLGTYQNLKKAMLQKMFV